MTATPASRAGGGSDDERSAAVHALEGSFSELLTVFRQYVSEAAETVSPGMLPGTFKVLSTVNRGGPVTLSALAEQLAADKGMLSRSVSELEGLGLVERSTDPGDKRSRLIVVTELGRQRLHAARAPHEGRLFAALEDWSIDEIRHVSSFLHALAAGETPPRHGERQA